MNTQVAFVGDVHGNHRALRGLMKALISVDTPETVFLGDYVNKGPNSAHVIEELIAFEQQGNATILKGNHESALLEAFDSRNLMPFLKMGGAMTIRSYVGSRVGADVLTEFMAAFPSSHFNALRRMPEVYESDDLIAKHAPSKLATTKYTISAHLPVGELPIIRRKSAQLDTGCGNDGGRLTALFWPSLDYLQVDGAGDLIQS